MRNERQNAEVGGSISLTRDDSREECIRVIKKQRLSLTSLTLDGSVDRTKGELTRE